MRVRTSLGIVALLLGSCVPAAGQAVTIQFADGLISVHAENAPIQTILAEWARVGETRIINADRLSGQVTVELERVPEREALSILLRGASGFIASAREESSNGMSRFGTIVIAPTTPKATSIARDQNARTPASADTSSSTVLTGVDGDADDEESERREIRSQLFGGREVDGQHGDGVVEAGARQAAPTTPAPANPSGTVVGSKRPGVTPAASK